MSEINKKEDGSPLTNKEKIELLKFTFSTLEIDEQAVFAQWCHEEVEKGGVKFLGKKMQETNEKMSSFISKAYDEVIRGSKTLYNKTNETFSSIDSSKDNKSNNQSPSFFD